jgi:uncharacterized protein (DUF2141 family)
MRKAAVLAVAVAALATTACDISSLIPQPPGSISGLVTTSQAQQQPLTLNVFAGTQNGQSIAVRSTYAQASIPPGENSAPFIIAQVQPGTYSVFAWRDANGNGTVDQGDWFGSTDNITVRGGQDTPGVAVSASQYTGQPIQVGR